MHLARLSLLVPDYDEAIDFFVSGLGFNLLEDVALSPEKRWVCVEPPQGGGALVLARAASPEQHAAIGNQAGGRVFLFLYTDDFHRDAQKIRASGGVFEETPRHEAYGTVAVFRDPFGNRWDLIEPAD